MARKRATFTALKNSILLFDKPLLIETANESNDKPMAIMIKLVISIIATNLKIVIYMAQKIEVCFIIFLEIK